MVTLKDFSSSSEYMQKFQKGTVKRQIEIANYIKQVSAQAGVDLEDIDILKLFGGSRKNLLMTNKGRINKILFNYAQENKPKESSPEVALANVVYRENLIKHHLEESRKTKLKRYKNNLSKANKDARTASSGYKQRLAERRQRKWQSEIEKLENAMDVNTVFEHLVNIARDKFWKFVEITDTHIIWITAKPIVLTEFNPRAGLSLKQNMGYYAARLNLSNCDVNILPHKNNCFAGGFYHPYVRPQKGGICLGNTYSFFKRVQKERDISGLMAVTASVISTYSSQGGPYRCLVDFVNEGQIVERTGNIVDPEERLKELLAKKSESTRQQVNSLANQIADSCEDDDIDEHCGDPECEDCNAEFGDIY